MPGATSAGPGSSNPATRLCAERLPSSTLKPLRVLAIAYACEPERGSEPGLGWTLVSCLTADHRVVVVTEAQHREAIRTYLQRVPNERLSFLFVEVPFWKPAGITSRPHPRLRDFVYYATWEIFAVAAAWKVCRARNIEVVHHVTFGNIMLPPLAALLPGKFVWGPIGPIEGIPWRFLKSERASVIARDLLRNLAAWAFLRASPTGLLARARASALLFKTSGAREMVEHRSSRCDAVLYDAPDRPTTVACERPGDIVRPLRAVAISRLEPHKGLFYAIAGFARFLRSGGEGMLTIFGEGPEKRRLLDEIGRLGLQCSVSLMGHVPQASVVEELSRADVLLHPAFREGFASACIEALGAGVPVLCQQRSGVLDMIDESCGIMVRADAPSELSTALGEALMTLYRDPQLRARLRTGAIRKKNDLSARRSTETLRSVYRHVTEGEATKSHSSSSKP